MSARFERILFLTILLSFFLFDVHDSFAGDEEGASCRRWFQRGEFVLAAHCYESLISKVKNPKEDKLLQLESWVRNAALALEKAAQKSKKRERAAYLRERALRLLQSKKALFAPKRRKIISILADKMEESIGYADLTVISHHQKASISIKGYHFQRQATGTFSAKVRPGYYTILVTYPDGGTQAKNVLLKPTRPLLVQFAPKKTPKKPRRIVAPMPRPISSSSLPLWLMGGGAALLLAGGGIVVWSILGTRKQAEEDLREALIHTGQEGHEYTYKAKLAYQDAVVQNTIGWIVTAIGGTTLSIGFVLQLFPKKRTSQLLKATFRFPLTSPSSQKMGKTLLFEGEY